MKEIDSLERKLENSVYISTLSIMSIGISISLFFYEETDRIAFDYPCHKGKPTARKRAKESQQLGEELNKITVSTDDLMNSLMRSNMQFAMYFAFFCSPKWNMYRFNISNSLCVWLSILRGHVWRSCTNIYEQQTWFYGNENTFLILDTSMNIFP